MKITRCKYGHYYDKAYFRECPHCCRARGGRDEDIIIGKNELSTDLSGKNSLPGRNVRINQLQDDSNYGQGSNRDISQKEQDRKKVERWIGEAWDELENVAKESPKTKVTEKAAQREKQEDRQEKITEEKNTVSVKKKHRNSEQNLGNYMLFAAMPLKVIKNQDFCLDFCIFPEKDWETGAKMLSFKSQESIRDLKPVQMALPTKAVLHILYKEEEIFHKDIELEAERENVFCTFPVTVTDTRDRRFHMIKAVFEIEEQNIEIPLYLMPNPYKKPGSYGKHSWNFIIAIFEKYLYNKI